MRSAPDKPIDVEAAIKTVTGGGGHFEVRAALESLAKVEPIEAQRDVVAEVLEQLVVQDSSHADAAANALANWHRPRTVLALMPLLAEDVWPHWKADKAIKVLGKTRDKRAVFPIIRWIVKKPDLVVAAMKDMGPVAEDEVIKLLREKDAAVRSNAARILQDIGTAKCLPELRRASKDPRDRAAATIAELALDVVNERVKQARAATTAPATAPAAGN